MDSRTVVPFGLALGVARFVLLMITAIGFVAMHGVAATDPAGLHHSPIGMSATTMANPDRGMSDPADRLTPAPLASAVAHDAGGVDHGMVAACLFVLLGALAAVAWRALRTGLSTSGSAVLQAVWQRCRPARAPPCPIFLSLCVFRL